jgi:hypothetical protein
MDGKLNVIDKQSKYYTMGEVQFCNELAGINYGILFDEVKIDELEVE